MVVLWLLCQPKSFGSWLWDFGLWTWAWQLCDFLLPGQCSPFKIFRFGFVLCWNPNKIVGHLHGRAPKWKTFISKWGGRLAVYAFAHCYIFLPLPRKWSLNSNALILCWERFLNVWISGTALAGGVKRHIMMMSNLDYDLLTYPSIQIILTINSSREASVIRATYSIHVIRDLLL